MERKIDWAKWAKWIVAASAAAIPSALTTACFGGDDCAGGCAGGPGDSGSFDSADASTSNLADVEVQSPDATTDATTDSGPAFLFWTESNVVRGATLDGGGARTIATGMVPTGIAIDLTAGKVYWADNGADTVSRANLDGTAVEVLYTSSDPFSNPSGVAVDHAANRIFWAEANVIKTANLDGTNVVVLYTGTFPTGVATNAAQMQLYFADNGTDTIRVGGYDGGATSVLYTAASPTANPAGVVVEPSEGQVFWGEGGGVFRMQADGGSPIKIASAGFPGGVAVDPLSLRLYFTDNADDSITSVGFDGGSPEVVYKSSNAFSNPYGVALRR